MTKRSILLFMVLAGTASARTYGLERIPLEFPGSIALANGEKAPLGGFSGLSCRRERGGAIIQCATHTDRGPNGEAAKCADEGNPRTCRPFRAPAFQPRILHFTVDLARKTVTPGKTVELRGPKGATLSGLPNDPSLDEAPVDDAGKPLRLDPAGMDIEAISADDGGYWMAEEYGPSIVRFGRDGRLLRRFVPQGSGNARFGSRKLGRPFARRGENRGFEGIAPGGGLVYAFLQSPLPSAAKSTWIRVVAFDAAKEKEVAQYVYPLEGTAADKIGDASYAGERSFYVIEQDSRTQPDDFKRIYKVDFAGATDVRDGARFADLEGLDAAALARKGVVTGKKVIVADLAALGAFDVEKFEGLSVLDDGTILLLNDNDFGLGDGGKLDPAKQSYLFVLTPANPA